MCVRVYYSVGLGTRLRSSTSPIASGLVVTTIHLCVSNVYFGNVLTHHLSLYCNNNIWSAMVTSYHVKVTKS